MNNNSSAVSGSPIIAAFQLARQAQQHKRSEQDDNDASDDDVECINNADDISDVEVIDDGNDASPAGAKDANDVPPAGAKDANDASPAGGNAQPNNRKRRLQQVSDLHWRSKVTQWMVETFERDGIKNLCVKTIKEFPSQFRGSNNANITKARNWWNKREELLNKSSSENPNGVAHRQRNIRRYVIRKAMSGRGAKRSEWVNWLYGELLSEFERLLKLGLKFSNAVLGNVAIDLVSKSEDPKFNKNYVDPKDGKKIIEKIDYTWIRSFMEAHNIVIRSQCGKQLVSPTKTEFIERSVAYHLGELQRGFDSGELNEDEIENIDETHFLVDMHTGKTLGFCGDEKIKYADVVSGGEGMTMIVRISGGKNAEICAPFMIFQNQNRSYPIRNLPDNIPGVSYRTQPKGWTDRKLFAEYFREKRAHYTRHSGERTIFLDNASGHNDTDELRSSLETAKASLHFFPENATDLVQPADSFVISKIKDVWRANWDLKKVELIQANNWQDRVRADGAWSGKLPQPGKRFFLQLAADAVRAVNAQRDEHGMSYARKAMIRCGLSLDTDGRWKETQLFPQLQTIIKKYRAQFDGEKVPHPSEIAAAAAAAAAASNKE